MYAYVVRFIIEGNEIFYITVFECISVQNTPITLSLFYSPINFIVFSVSDIHVLVTEVYYYFERLYFSFIQFE